MENLFFYPKNWLETLYWCEKKRDFSTHKRKETFLLIKEKNFKKVACKETFLLTKEKNFKKAACKRRIVKEFVVQKKMGSFLDKYLKNGITKSFWEGFYSIVLKGNAMHLVEKAKLS